MRALLPTRRDECSDAPGAIVESEPGRVAVGALLPVRASAALLVVAGLALASRAEAQDLVSLTGQQCALRADGVEVCADLCGSFLGTQPGEGVGIVTQWSSTGSFPPLAIRDPSGVPWTHTVRGRRRSPTRAPVPGLTHVASLSSTYDDACAVDDAGGVWCWGVPYHGSEGGSALGPTPIRVEGVDDAVDVVVGVQTRAVPPDVRTREPAARSACARTRSRGVVCWSWMVERARRAPMLVPVAVRGAEAATAITSTAISGRDFCALLPDGSVQCWEVLRSLGQTTCGEARRRCATPIIPVRDPERLPETVASVQYGCVIGASPERRVLCLGFDPRYRSMVWSRVPELDGAVQIRSEHGWGNGASTCALDGEGRMRCSYVVSEHLCDGGAGD